MIAVSIEARKNGRRKSFKTGVRVPPKHWDKENGAVKTSHNEFLAMNTVIYKSVKKLKEIHTNVLLEGIDATLEDLEDRYFQKESPRLVEYIRDCIESETEVAYSTQVAWLDTLKKLVDMDPNVRLINVNYTFVERFDRWMRLKGLSQNTIHKHHKHLKKFLNHAIRKKAYPKARYPYGEFKVARIETEREYLTLEELHQLESFEASRLNETDQHVRSMFLFSCYTGLRMSDVFRLSLSHITRSSRGYKIVITTKKVKKKAEIPLFLLFPLADGKRTRPELLLETYLERSREKVFPTYSETTLNRRLRSIVARAGIQKQLSFHAGRHTFGTLMAVRAPLPVLQRLMQHSDVKTTMIYVNLNTELMEKSLEEISW